MPYNFRRRAQRFSGTDRVERECRVQLVRLNATLMTVKRGSASKRLKLKPVLVDELPRGALPTPAELKQLNKLADKVASGKAKVRYLDI